MMIAYALLLGLTAAAGARVIEALLPTQPKSTAFIRVYGIGYPLLAVVETMRSLMRMILPRLLPRGLSVTP